MAAKKENPKAKKASSKKASPDKLREDHPFETDSQIQNRYGKGREKSGSDGTQQSERGSNH
ncbi:MAG TPA: hypothetical protein VEY10_14320 [Flavisolibacter sp.]|jgi:hypothetical protein|nr:hypothetical protein [Flavisolibacter sp.]